MVASATRQTPVLPMTEPEAWRYLERIWSAAVDFGDGRYCVFTHEGCGQASFSLTDCARNLKRAGLISGDTFVRMVSAAFWAFGEAGSAFAWPLTETGAEARARACRILAERNDR